MGCDTILLLQPSSLVSLLSRCNPVQVVLSIQSVSAALSSLQACVNHRPLPLSLLLPGHQSSPSISLSFSPFFLLVSSSALLSLHPTQSQSLPIHLMLFSDEPLILLPPLHINKFYSPSPLLSSPRLLHFLFLSNLLFFFLPLLHHPCFNITFVCDCF